MSRRLPVDSDSEMGSESADIPVETRPTRSRQPSKKKAINGAYSSFTIVSRPFVL